MRGVAESKVALAESGYVVLPRPLILLFFVFQNGTAHFKNVNSCLNTNIYSYLETSGGQSFNLYLNAVYFFNASVN